MATAIGWRIFFRSLFVQASWNFSGMQGLGFFFMTWPALSRRRLPAGELARAGLRNLGTFNTNPYFAGLVAATVIREEESGGSIESVEGIKRSLMCALGSVGDEFFWATLRPLAALAALPAALAGVLWAPLITLALYNLPHIAVRAWGISAGLARGSRVVESLLRHPLSRALPALGAATTFLTGFLVASGADEHSWGLLPGRGLISAGVSLVAFALFSALLSRGCGQGRLLACASALAAIAGAVGVVGAP